jgi:pilus assembly protein CpaC
LAIAGLLNNEIDGATRRVPLLGDLPFLGPLFSLTSHDVIEQELLVTVTPYLIGPMDADQPILLPGQEVMEPNDLEFYLLNRIEGRLGRAHRSTTQWDNPFHRHTDMQTPIQMQIERHYLWGPVGLSD